MKTSILFIVGITTLIFTSCGKNNGTYDASGIFEAREVTVSARSTGELIQFDIEEGQKLEAGKQAGYIDTVQLHLKKMQLLAGMKSVESRQYNVSRQIASIQQQIATQKTEQKRFENLVQSNAANRKQLDDINAQIALLEKQLSAQTETLENNNRSVSGESLGLTRYRRVLSQALSMELCCRNTPNRANWPYRDGHCSRWPISRI